MSSNTVTVAEDVATAAPAGRAALRERGLATVEYAIGIILVIAIMAALIAATNQGWFNEAVKKVIELLFDLIGTALRGGAK